MNIVTGHDEAVARWVSDIIGKPFHAPFTAFGLVDHAGRLRGAFVFTTYTGASVNMSLAGSACLTRGAWRAVIDYVFRQLGCVRLEVHTRRGNKLVSRTATRLGFRFEGTARRLYGDADGMCYSIVADDLPAFRARWRI